MSESIRHPLFTWLFPFPISSGPIPDSLLPIPYSPIPAPLIPTPSILAYSSSLVKGHHVQAGRVRGRTTLHPPKTATRPTKKTLGETCDQACPNEQLPVELKTAMPPGLARSLLLSGPYLALVPPPRSLEGCAFQTGRRSKSGGEVAGDSGRSWA